MGTSKDLSRLDNVKKWVAALESGKYRQGACKLRTTTGAFCCLGVACDVVAPDQWTLNSSGQYVNTYNNPSNTQYFDPPMVAALGIRPEFAYYLVDLNDTGKYTFKDLAEFIRLEFNLND